MRLTPYPIAHTPYPRSRSGQTIAEVLVAIAVGGVLIGGALSLILPSLRSNTQVTNVQAGSTVAKGMLDNVRVFSEGGWNNLLALATGSANTYFLQTAKSPFVAATGTEAIPYDGITAGLVGWWKFDEGVGSTTADSSGNANTGTWSGAAVGTAGTYYTTGRIGQYAGAFNGSLDYVSISNASNKVFPATGSPFTLAMWVYASSLPGSSISSLIDFDNYLSSGFRFGLCAAGNLYGCPAGSLFFWSGEDAGSLGLQSSILLSAAQWFHVVMVYTGSNATFYINAKPAGSAAGSIVIPTNSFFLAKTFGYGAWPGFIDDFRMYNRALSSGEITQIYSASYKRYFYLNDVYRDGSGAITSSGGSYDPSTKQVTVGYSWVGSATQTLGTYLTRNANNVIDQTDWSGGAIASGTVVTSTKNQFATSSNIDFSTINGSFSIPIASSGP